MGSLDGCDFTTYVCMHVCMCSKYGFSMAIYEGILYYALELCLLMGMLWADGLS